MVALYFRKFKTRGLYADLAVFRKTVNDQMLHRVDPVIMSALQDRAKGWSTPPTFIAGTGFRPSGITHHVRPQGAGADKWGWVSQGVKGHWIEVKHKFGYRPGAKRTTTLSMQKYAPFTYPGGFFGGAGVRVGPVAYRRAVFWPGIKPRHLEQDVATQLRGWYLHEMENILRIAVRAAQAAAR